MRKLLISACLCTTLSTVSFPDGSLGFVSVAHAEEAPSAEDVKRAAAAFDRGREAYKVESYVEAAEQFEAADEYASSPAALRLAIVSRKAAGQMDRATTLAALALSLYPEDRTLENEARTLIDEQSSSLAQIEVSCDEECVLLLDNKIVHGKAAVNRVLYVTPGTHTVRAGWSKERSESKKATALVGETVRLAFSAPVIPVTSAPSDPVVDFSTSSEPGEKAKGGWSPAVFWTGVGVTAVGAGVSTFLGVRAQNEPGRDAVREGCVGQGTECPLYQQGVENQTVANIAIGATAAVGVFTIITGIWLTDWSGGEEKEREPLALRRGDFSVKPTFSVGGGATLGATGTF